VLKAIVLISTREAAGEAAREAVREVEVGATALTAFNKSLNT